MSLTPLQLPIEQAGVPKASPSVNKYHRFVAWQNHLPRTAVTDRDFLQVDTRLLGPRKSTQPKHVTKRRFDFA
jgi:hypothetical protein